MKCLSQLTPAETWLLLHGEGAALRSLLKYTFLDLLLKQVLVVKEIQRQAHTKDPAKVYKYVMPGTAFPDYQHKVHEIVFLSPFKTDSGLKILFQNLVKISYEKAESDKMYYSYIIANPYMKGNFRRSFYQKMVGGFGYTADGLNLKEILKKEIRDVEEELSVLLKTNREKANGILRCIGGNVFLINVVDGSLGDEFDKESRRPVDQTTGCSTACSGFDHHSSDFDNSCSWMFGRWRLFSWRWMWWLWRRLISNITTGLREGGRRVSIKKII